MLKFSQLKHNQYGLNQVSNLKEFENKLDKGIAGLEKELQEKSESIRGLKKELIDLTS